jgi:hypothetical protein
MSEKEMENEEKGRKTKKLLKLLEKEKSNMVNHSRT